MPAHKIIIEAGRTERNYWWDLWRYRELFYFLAWRDLLVRYKQTAVGVAWALIRPFLTMLVLVVIFSRLAHLPSEGDPRYYAIMVIAGMLPWQFFSNAVSESSNSLVTNSNLISKVYFPRLIVPAGSVIASLVDFLITFALLLGMMAWYRYSPDWHLLFLPLFSLLALGVTLGCGLWFSAMTVRYRDIRYVVPFIVQFGMYVSPVGFKSAIVPGKWRLLYSLNPMVGVIDGFRWSVMRGEAPLYWPSLLAAAGWMVVFMLSGICYFRHTEKGFADVI